MRIWRRSNAALRTQGSAAKSRGSGRSWSPWPALLHDARVSFLAKNGTDITDVSSPKRTIPERLRRWVERAHPRCGVAGCEVDRFLQIDHIVDVALHGPTSKDNIWRLCNHHHRLKTAYNWRVVTDEHGIRHLVPPNEPEQPP